MSFTRLRELAALLQPPRTAEQVVETKVPPNFESLKTSVDDAMEEVLWWLTDGGAFDSMLRKHNLEKMAKPTLDELFKACDTFKKAVDLALTEAEGMLMMVEGRRVDEMAKVGEFSSGWLKRSEAKRLVQAFKDGKEVVELSNGSKYKAVKSVSGAAIEKGMILFASYNGSNQGAELYEVLGVSDRPDDDTVKHDSVKAAMKAHGVTSIGGLDDKCNVVVKDLEDGYQGGFFYVYKNSWVRGSGAERLSFTLVEKVS